MLGCEVGADGPARDTDGAACGAEWTGWPGRYRIAVSDGDCRSSDPGRVDCAIPRVGRWLEMRAAARLTGEYIMVIDGQRAEMQYRSERLANGYETLGLARPLYLVTPDYAEIELFRSDVHTTLCGGLDIRSGVMVDGEYGSNGWILFAYRD